jgi:hypothetical protein|tara:strand:- start:37 stop:450 length:414 start_codon:yes stop_codon:yes gene_type:complete
MRKNKKNWEIFSKSVKNNAIVCDHIPTTPALIMTTHKEKKMITFTDKEKQLAQYFIDVTDGSNSVIFENPKQLGWDVETARGVFASLVKKEIIFPDDALEMDDYVVHYWMVDVETDDEGRLINTVDELLEEKNKVAQ